jgi:DNA-binding MurR/RpiR family transcriptional regulator
VTVVESLAVARTDSLLAEEGKAPEASGSDAAGWMAAGGVRAAIRATLSSLQPADARVARVFLEDPSGVVYQTVTEVAARAETSASTVVRACQELGFRGFHDLKLALAHDLGAGTVAGRDIGEGDAPGDVLRKVLASDAEAIRGSLSTIDEAAFARAVDAVDRARAILFVGVGTSAPLAQDAAYRFLTIGIDARAPADVHVQHVGARLLRPDDVCFAISHTGSTRETVEEAAAAREAGATAIALSSFFRSPLAEVADILLVAGGSEHSFRIEAMASRIGHLSVLDALFVAVAMRRPEQARETIEEVGRTLSAHRF